MTIAKCWKTRTTCPRYIAHCSCSDALSSSQHSIVDWWSLAHVFWGAVYSIPLLGGVNALLCFFITVSLAILYELIENMGIGLRIANALCGTCNNANYDGDHFWNSVADIFCCLLGYVIVFVSTANYNGHF